MLALERDRESIREQYSNCSLDMPGWTVFRFKKREPVDNLEEGMGSVTKGGLYWKRGGGEKRDAWTLITRFLVRSPCSSMRRLYRYSLKIMSTFSTLWLVSAHGEIIFSSSSAMERCWPRLSIACCSRLLCRKKLIIIQTSLLIYTL